jgi:predicted nucleic-acid-binding protein
MATNVQLHDVVALMEDVEVTHLLTHEPLRLRRGQIGTVVMLLDDDHFEVEFADRGGRAYAMLPLSASQLMVLREQPEAIPA